MDPRWKERRKTVNSQGWIARTVLGLEIDSHVGGKKEGDVLETSEPYPAAIPIPA